MSLRVIKAGRSTYHVADPHEMERECQQWDDEILECRTWGHHWVAGRAVFNNAHRYYHIMQRCRNCESERVQDLDRYGHPLSRPVIHYSEGYLAKGLGRIAGAAKDVVRLATVTRVYKVEKVTGKKAEAELPTSRIAREALSKEAG
jgi:hypothetical protein